MPSILKLLITTDAIGGVWTYTINLADALRSTGMSIIIAALGPPPSPAQIAQASRTGAELHILDAPLDWLAENETGVAQAAHAIETLARKCQADLVQVHSPALIARTAMPAPVISLVHSCVATWWDAVRGGPLPEDMRWRAELAAQGLARASVNIAPSRSFAADLARIYGLAAPNVVRNARAYPPLAQKDPARFILSAGRFWDEGKNLATLDQAARTCALPVIAAGPLIAPDGASVTATHINARGALDPAALQVLLSQRPVFCSPAVYEPFGLAVLEAAQAGCALVLSDIPTFRELWSDAALFAPPRDAQAFAAALNALACDRAKRLELGDAAQWRAKQFKPAQQARDMIQIYEAVLRTRVEAA